MEQRHSRVLFPLHDTLNLVKHYVLNKNSSEASRTVRAQQGGRRLQLIGRFSICVLVSSRLSSTRVLDIYVISRSPSTVPERIEPSTDLKPGSVLDAFSKLPVHRVYIRGDSCGLGTVKYPRMHFAFPGFEILVCKL